MVNNSNTLVFFGEYAVEFKFNTDTAFKTNVLPVASNQFWSLAMNLNSYSLPVLILVTLSPLYPLGLSKLSWLK